MQGGPNMSTEKAIYVYLSQSEWDQSFRPLVEKATASVRRQNKTMQRDRHEILRYDNICTQLEILAWKYIEAGAQSVALEPEEIAALDMHSDEELRHPWHTSV